jgi:sortase A
MQPDNSNYDIQNILQQQIQKPDPPTDPVQNAAVEIVRSKLRQLYVEEPDVHTEMSEISAETEQQIELSIHQKYLKDLQDSGRNPMQIQDEWHAYYARLPDDQKHDVWREFNQKKPLITPEKKPYERPARHNPKQTKSKPTRPKILTRNPQPKQAQPDRTIEQIELDIQEKAKKAKYSPPGKLTKVDHLKSLMFGIGLATTLVTVLLFTFFNERFIAPFITPSRNIVVTPIIGYGSETVSPDPKIIIPKINLEIPVVYDVGSIQEDSIQKALESGVVHYDSTPKPGEQGNMVIVGHSSNNIFNKGKYKFAFVLLRNMDVGDKILIQKDSKLYTYIVYRNEVVEPSNVSVLTKADRDNTITLITCDPPGTTLNRRIVVAEQISPSPKDNQPPTSKDLGASDSVPGNADSLLQNIQGIF